MARSGQILSRSDEPLSYYHRKGPVGDVFDAANRSGRLTDVGIIGLGAGTIATYARPGQNFTFYEIDPAVERIARDPRYFTFLSDCRGNCDVVLGDGRLTMAAAPDRHFDLIVLDAFSSDAIPTHLLTRQAIDMYLSKLKPDGLLVFHVSNLFFTLEPLLANTAASKGLACLARDRSAAAPGRGRRWQVRFAVRGDVQIGGDSGPAEGDARLAQAGRPGRPARVDRPILRRARPAQTREDLDPRPVQRDGWFAGAMTDWC